MDQDRTGDAAPPAQAFYFDGSSSRRHAVTLRFAEQLEICRDDGTLASWPYGDIRRPDAPAGIRRATAVSAPPLARLEIRDAALAADLAARCPRLDESAPGRGVAAIVGWSLAAAASIVLVVLFGVPLAADRLAPLVPQSFEKRLGDVADAQIKTVFEAKICDNAAGQAAFTKLMNALRGAAGLEIPVDAAVLSSPIPNAFALPGGRVYLFSGLLDKADNADEIAGVMAHELGHLKHRDSTRSLIYNGGTSFLIGLLFGDLTGSSAVIFASRTLITASYSREAEHAADTTSIEAMLALGRSARSMGELMFRITGKEADKGISILANHPLTEDRLARMKQQDRPPTGAPLLTSDEWKALKAICK